MSEMLITVKAREVQRGQLAEMGGERALAARHFLAAAHLELVLANDYALDGQDDLAFRSSLSAASCFWRAGHANQAQAVFDELLQEQPTHEAAIRDVLAELERAYPR